MDKVGGKKDVKKKKMMGGEEKNDEQKLNFNTSLSIFINNHFPRNNGGIKIDILKRMKEILHRNQTRIKSQFKQYIFYIFRTEPRPTQIISAGIISGSHGTPIITKNRQGKITGTYNKNYLYLRCLLSRESGNRGGTSAIYHILTRLPKHYDGICLITTPSSRPYYNKLGFYLDALEQVRVLDKTPEIMSRLEEIIQKRGPITTEFYSTYPNNLII